MIPHDCNVCCNSTINTISCYQFPDFYALVIPFTALCEARWHSGLLITSPAFMINRSLVRIPATRCWVQHWASCWHTCASVTKQYNLVPVNGRWCLAAGKSQASHWSSITDTSGSHLWAQALEEGDEHPNMHSCGAWLTLPLPSLFRHCWLGDMKVCKNNPAPATPKGSSLDNLQGN